MASPSVQLPDELIKLRSLYTLSGLASMVWLICLVIAQLMPHPDTLAPWHWRLIAFTLSCGLTFYTTILRRTRARGKWGLAVLNSFLVFVNASGINAVTSGLSFIDKDTAVVKEVNAATHASIYLLDAQVNWWPDTHLVRANEELKAETLSLAQQNDSLAQKIQIMINQGAGPADLMHCAQRLDSLQQKATELRAHVDALTGQLAACRTARGNGKPKAVTPPVKAGGTDAKPYIVKSGKGKWDVSYAGKKLRILGDTLSAVKVENKQFFIVERGGRFGVLDTTNVLVIPCVHQSMAKVAGLIEIYLMKPPTGYGL